MRGGVANDAGGGGSRSDKEVTQSADSATTDGRGAPAARGIHKISSHFHLRQGSRTQAKFGVVHSRSVRSGVTLNQGSLRAGVSDSHRSRGRGTIVAGHRVPAPGFRREREAVEQRGLHIGRCVECRRPGPNVRRYIADPMSKKSRRSELGRRTNRTTHLSAIARGRRRLGRPRNLGAARFARRKDDPVRPVRVGRLQRRRTCRFGDRRLQRHLRFRADRTVAAPRQRLGRGDVCPAGIDLERPRRCRCCRGGGRRQRDGKLDLLVSGRTKGRGTVAGNTVGAYVLLGNGDGTFQTATPIVAAASS